MTNNCTFVPQAWPRFRIASSMCLRPLNNTRCYRTCNHWPRSHPNQSFSSLNCRCLRFDEDENFVESVLPYIRSLKLPKKLKLRLCLQNLLLREMTKHKDNMATYINYFPSKSFCTFDLEEQFYWGLIPFFKNLNANERLDVRIDFFAELQKVFLSSKKVADAKKEVAKQNAATNKALTEDWRRPSMRKPASDTSATYHDDDSLTSIEDFDKKRAVSISFKTRDQIPSSMYGFHSNYSLSDKESEMESEKDTDSDNKAKKNKCCPRKKKTKKIDSIESLKA